MVFKGHPNVLINHNANICSVMRRSGRFHLRQVIKFSLRPRMSRDIIIVSWHDALGRICSTKDVGARVKWIAAGIASFRKKKKKLSKRNWRGGSFGKTLATQSRRSPAHYEKPGTAVCVCSPSAGETKMEGIPGETPDAEVVSGLYTRTQEQAHHQSIHPCTTVRSSAHQRGWAFLLPHRP